MLIHAKWFWIQRTVCMLHPWITFSECYKRDNLNKKRRDQTQLSRNEDVEMGKREDQVGPHQEWWHREESIRKSHWNFPGKQKIKVVWPLLEARTQPHLSEFTETRSFWETKQRSTEKEMEEQHKGRHEEITTDRRHGTRQKILDDKDNDRPCTRRWSRKMRNKWDNWPIPGETTLS